MLDEAGFRAICNYCDKKFIAYGLLGGEFVCNIYYKQSPLFLEKKRLYQEKHKK